MNHEEDEGREGHEARRSPMRLRSPLSPETERVMTQTIGCAIAVHRALGPGFLESIYREAMCIELTTRGLLYERERRISVRYRNVPISGQRIDLLIEGVVVVELKSVAHFDDVHSAQVISYLKTTGLRAGLLINFRVRLLRDGLKRFVL
jgi:GxxExxY protein